ncbi:MAG: Hsp70 family protein [Planctomycetota bacterium]
MSETPTFGIDLGTTCSAIALVQNGHPRLLLIDGEDLVPSVVSWPPGGEPLVGIPALNRLALDPERTVRSAKRHMGTDRRWTIDGRVISAPEVSARILERLARGAAEATGRRVRRVVITVPAWFTHGQRADTMRAAEIAGLEVARLINEPTAAALAHAHRQDLRRRALVYDLGGGTFDASLVEQDGAVVEVRASRGDTRLGGDDLDQALAEIVLARLAEEDPALRAAIAGSIPAQTRLLLAVQATKHELSATLRARVRVPFLLDLGGEARHLEAELERAELEEAARPLLERTLRCVEEVLADGGMRAAELDELLLVGGSTRIPLVWSLLRERTGLEGNAAVPPERAVALGAAIQAAIVDGSRVDGVLVDVAPYSISVAALAHLGDGGHCMTCRVLTPRNSPLPARHTEVFSTTHPVQDTVLIPVLQGSDPNPLRNAALGEIELRGLPPAPPPRTSRPISVEFRHDLDGMVSIRVTDELSGRTADGRVAAGGVEVAGLREKLRRELETEGILPGDGRDPDPFLEREERAGRSERPAVPAPLLADPASGDLEEARHAFATVLEREAELARSHSAHACALAELAAEGRDALARGEAAAALARYDELSDRLFELGIWL